MKALKFIFVISTLVIINHLPAKGMSGKDTVIINFGNNVEIVIQTPRNDGTGEIEKVDINQMIDDIQRAMDTLKQSKEGIVLENEEGSKYLKEGRRDFDGTIRITIKDPASFEQQMEAFGENMEAWGASIEKRFQEGRCASKESGDTISINIGKDHPTYETDFTFNFDLGMNNYLSNGEFPGKDHALYAVKPWGSWYVGINGIYNIHVAGPVFLETGGGISWYNFKFEDARTRLNQTNDATVYFQTMEDLRAIKSKLTVSYINFSMVPLLDFSGTETRETQAGPVKIIRKKQTGFRIGAGAFAGYRLGSHTKYKYEDDGGKEKDKDRKSFYLNNWRYGARFQVGFKGVDLYANYDVSELFLENRGPSLNAFSFGLIF